MFKTFDNKPYFLKPKLNQTFKKYAKSSYIGKVLCFILYTQIQKLNFWYFSNKERFGKIQKKAFGA